jgi:hypothetical protein
MGEPARRMDEARVRALVAELDAAVPRQGARVRLEVYGGGPDESQAVANRTGTLRLGVELLRAALKAMDEEAAGRRAVAAVDAEALLDPASTVEIGVVELRDVLGPPRMTASRAGRRAGALACGTLTLAALVVFGIGLATVIGWIGG